VARQTSIIIFRYAMSTLGCCCCCCWLVSFHSIVIEHQWLSISLGCGCLVEMHLLSWYVIDSCRTGSSSITRVLNAFYLVSVEELLWVSRAKTLKCLLPMPILEFLSLVTIPSDRSLNIPSLNGCFHIRRRWSALRYELCVCFRVDQDKDRGLWEAVLIELIETN
jgi:hypothetical protein